MIVSKHFSLLTPTEDDMRVSISDEESDELIDELIQREVERQRNLDETISKLRDGKKISLHDDEALREFIRHVIEKYSGIDRDDLIKMIIMDFNNPLERVSHE